MRFGELEIVNNEVINFAEKLQTKASWISGGFFVLDVKVLDYIKNDQILFEREPLEKLTAEKQLVAYQHKSFWQCMDTMRDKILLNKLWTENKAPWKK